MKKNKERKNHINKESEKYKMKYQRCTILRDYQ